jgi:hypothetical protein
MEKEYHIDVTPEEDNLYRNEEEVNKHHKKMNKKIIAIVVAFHILGAVGIYAMSPKQSPAPLSDAIKPVPESTPSAICVPMDAKPPALPPVPVVEKPVPKATPKPVPKSVLMHTVNKGDTIYSIAKRYKMKVETLVKLNALKDASKIQIGQVLKVK